MKRKKGFIVRQVAGQHVAVAVGEASKEFHGMLTLNETGLFIWNMLEYDTDENKIVSAILLEYEVGEQRARDDVRRVLEALTNAGIIED